MKNTLRKATKFRLTKGRKPKSREELEQWDPIEWVASRRCKNCKKPFNPKRAHQKYCSPVCTNQAWITKIVKEFK